MFETKSRELCRLLKWVKELPDRSAGVGVEEFLRTTSPPRTLKGVHDAIARHLPAEGEESEALDQARSARNYLAHEGLIVSLSAGEDAVFEALQEMRSQVRLLAKGDNLISEWLFTMWKDRQEPLPRHLIDSYEAVVDGWVFEPVWETVEPDRDGPPVGWRLLSKALQEGLSKRGTDQARGAIQGPCA